MYKFTTEAKACTEISRLSSKVVMAATINNDTETLDAAYKAIREAAKSLDWYIYYPEASRKESVERDMQRAIECVRRIKGSACQR